MCSLLFRTISLSRVLFAFTLLIATVATLGEVSPARGNDEILAPDLSKVIYPEGKPGFIEYFVRDIEDLAGRGKPLRTPELAYQYIYPPKFSPNSKKIAMAVGPHRDIWVVDADRKNPKNLTGGRIQNDSVDFFWSPDSS